MFYLFRNTVTNEVVEVWQKMDEPHTYGVDGEWERLFTAPQISTNTKLDPFDVKSFLNKTDKPTTLGDLWDRSRELSMKRADKIGADDPIKEKALKEHAKVRGGKKHEEAIKIPNKIVI